MPEILHNTLTINKRIKLLREKNNLKQEGFAEKIGAKRGNVAQWEAGNNYPALDYLTKICEVFNVTADWLLLGVSPEIKRDAPNDTPLNEIVNVLKDLAGSARKIESSLATLASGIVSTSPQNHTQGISENERIRASQDEALFEATDLKSRQAEEILKQKKENLKGS